ncbi:putative Glutamyl-tRNA(Gln) amidotransferase subunit F, mitochondrial [Seiridium cardinale]
MNTTICTRCQVALRQQRLGLQTAQRSIQSLSSRSLEPRPRPRTFSRSATAFSSSDLCSNRPRDPTPREILAQPTWSVRSLLPPSSSEGTPSAALEQDEEITPSTLRHLLRLSALPPPSSPEEESQLLNTLRSQLHFVRNIQSIDTTGVEPLVSIRDETSQGVQEQTVGLDALKEALGREDVIGHNKRPRRRREEGKKEQIKGVEDWDVLKGASEKVGRYFVVRSGPPK